MNYPPPNSLMLVQVGGFQLHHLVREMIESPYGLPIAPLAFVVWVSPNHSWTVPAPNVDADAAHKQHDALTGINYGGVLPINDLLCVYLFYTY